MLNFVNGLFSINYAKYLADLFGVLFGVFGSHIKTVLLNILGSIWNLVVKYVWMICKWVLGALDAMQLAFTRLLGLYTSTGADMTADDYINGMKQITVSGGSNYYDYIMKIFKAMVIVAIVLMIVFTIIAMVMQDYNLAVNGYSKADNSKGKLIKMILTNIISICLMPLIFYTVIVGVNSILSSFYKALGNYSDTTIAGNVLAASTYDANRYRAYANAGQRIPITISVYSTKGSDDEVKKQLQNEETQEKLKAIAGAFANNSFLPFEKSTVYINDNWSSYPNYSLTYDNTVYDDMGQYFENFICTREQYYVLADFIDYCQLYNINYYIKEISETDICWQYVSNVKANSEIDEYGNATGDITLTVSYKDAETINNPSETASAASGLSSNDTYTLKLTTKADLTSPISDALKTASTLLGLTEETSSFNAMERDNSGDYTNLVEWSTEKVVLKLSDSFDINNSRTWTFADQIIVYEYYRFQNNFNSTNNTLEDYTIDQLKSTGAKLDVLQLSYRNYNSNTQSYSDEKSLLCVKINGNYYRVTQSERYFDDYGKAYYELDVLDPNVKYFKDATVKIQETSSVATRLSENFDINKPYTTATAADGSTNKTWNWTFTDQVLVYEYFTNGRISNGTKSVVNFDKLKHGVDTGDNGFRFNIYKITTGSSDKYYIRINNVYYECDSSGALKATTGSNTNFLIDAETAGNWWYGYNLTTSDKEKYGINNLNLIFGADITNPDTIDVLSDTLDNSDAFYQKYSGISRKLSGNFSFYNSDTWTFKDYAIMYFYVNYLKEDLSTTVDSLQVFGIKGDIVKAKVNGGDEKYYVKISQSIKNGAGVITSRKIYLDIEEFSKISELKITSSLSMDIFESLNLSSSATNLIKSFNSELSSDYLINGEVSSQVFYVSEDFDAFLPTTWTIGDYLLLFLADNGYIETDDELYLFQKQGYKALIYEIEGNKYYRFGKNITTDSGSENNNVYFLSENAIKKMGFSVKKFLNTNLLSFLLQNKYNLNFNNLYYSEDEFAADVISNGANNIYNVSSDFSNIKNLQYILASDFLINNSDVILSDLNKVKYTYSNPKLDQTNLASWNILDAAIYLKTGTLPTTDNPYTSYLYKYTDGKIYMLVEDVFVNISSSIYTGVGSSMLTEQIISNTIKSFSSTTLYDEYYDNNFASAFLSLGENTSGKITIKTEIKNVGEKFYYVTTTTDNSDPTTPVVTTDETEIEIDKIYYFSNNLKGSGTATIKENQALTSFEIIMAKVGASLSSDGYYCFDKYIIDGETYVKLTSDTYFSISNLTSSAVYYQENSLLANTNYLFTANGSYTAFDDDLTNDKRTISKTQINKYDALLYTITNSTAKTEYTIYENSGNKYLFVDGKIVKYDATLAGEVQKIGSLADCFAGSTEEERKAEALAHAKALYDNYYNKFVSTGAPTIVGEYSASALYEYKEFDVEDMTTWTGLSIILNFITGTDEPYELSVSDGANFTLIESLNNSYYLKVNVNEMIYYISISGLINTNGIRSYSSNGAINVTLKDIEQDALFLRLARVKKTISGSDALYSLASVEQVLASNLSDSVSNKTNLTDYRNNCLQIGDSLDEIKGNIVDKWNWLGLISLYYEPAENDELIISSYYYNGENYYVFSGGFNTYIVPVRLFGKLNGSFAASEYSLNSSSNIGKVIDSKGQLAGSKIYQFTSTSMPTFYLVQKDINGNYYAIYNLSDAENTYTSSVKYIKVNLSGSAISSTEEVDAISSASLFSYSTKNISDRKDWNIFDYIFAYVTGNQYGLSISSAIYKYADNYYIKYEDKYILLPFTGEVKSYLKYNSTELMLQIDANKLQVLIETLQSTYMTSEGDEYCLIKYANAAHTDLSAKLYDFERKFCEDNGDKIHGEGDSLMRIDFSTNFNVSDYTTWTYSDFVIYYAFSQGMFGEDLASYKFPFVYVPTWTKSGSTYYNLTYLDLILVDYYGTRATTAVDGKYPLEETTYFDRTDASYNFYLYYISSGANKGYYLTLNSDGEEEYYITLSDNIKLDFTAMKVTPELLGENLTFDDIKDKLLETPEDALTGTAASNIKEDSGITAYLTDFIGKNFQTFVNAHGAPGYTYYLMKQSVENGSTEANYVINFALESTKGLTGTYFNYETFYEFYEYNLKNYLETTKENSLDVSMSLNKNEVKGDVKVEIRYENYYPDLAFVNYYYFSYASNSTSSNLETIENVSTETKTAIINGNGYEKKLINLQLSSGFKINDISTWTVLDYILVYEFSNERVNSNFFKDMLFSELKDEYLKNIAYTDGNEGYYLYINNNFYNISNFVENRSDCLYGLTTKKINANDSGTVTKIETGSVGSYSFRVPYETINFSVNPMYSGTVEYYRDKNNITLTKDNILTYYYIDTDVADTNYRINVSQFAYYSTKKYIRTVSWVEKLMNDMQIYYPDLNWGVLIATDGWLDTLGEFTSAHNNGLYISGENSANTTAAGLVLSEFFISKATAVTDSYADYEYSSMFDQETVDALMRSLMGEENYEALSLEAEVFMDFFNSCFAPIIDDFAEEFGESIGDNSLRLNAYKSYLATLLLSSDIGEYLYTVATRIYAEYTIGEYLAKSCGDYSGYYNYVNQLTDQDGNATNSFSYGSFIELLKYENEYCGNNNPTFTFNFKKAFNHYSVDGKILNYTYTQVMDNSSVYELVAQYIIDAINDDYDAIYENDYDVSEDWTVINVDGEEVVSYYGEDYVYCYMIHVYWDIVYEIKGTKPSYLQLYKKYIDGDVNRWGLLYDSEIETADQYFENYFLDQGKLTLYKTLSSAASLRLFMPAMTVSEVTDSGIENIILSSIDTIIDGIELIEGAAKDLIKDGKFSDNTKTNLGEFLADGTLPIANVIDICSGDKELAEDVSYVAQKAIIISMIMELSEESTNGVSSLMAQVLEKLGFSISSDKETNWNIINKYYDAISDIISELKDVQDILPGQTTNRGSSREICGTGVYYTDEQLDQIINAFSNVKTNLKNYIATQTKLDKAQKKSITFTLAQYGSNYVSSGYSFSIKNKTYTFKSNIDPTRLAEYVYGGAFLEEVGVGSQYTSGDFNGIVNSSRVYDNEAGTMKTKLSSWPELRQFASAIAKETAELYFTTNLADLDISKENAIWLTDKINVTNKSGTGKTTSETVEEMLYSYIISEINEDIVKRITNSDGSDGNTIHDYTHEKFVAMGKYIFSNDIEDDALDDITMEEFKRIVMRKLIDNDQNENETPDERAGRYLTLYNLLSVQVEYQTTDASNTELGRIIAKGNIRRSDGFVEYSPNVANYGARSASGVVNYGFSALAGSNVKATFLCSFNTLEVVKTISGLENKPTRDVLTREYAGKDPGDYWDESSGHTFIACTRQNGKYYPILGTGSRNYSETTTVDGNTIVGDYDRYMNDGFLNHKFVTDYYDNSANVVVMKGIITADGYPTAIRKYKNPLEVEQKKLLKTTTETYSAVTYYRTNVGVNFGEGEDLVNASRAVSKVTTQNYTKYESNTSYTGEFGSNTTYTGRTNMKTVVSSDYSTSLVQSNVEYLMTEADGYGAISVLDEFSYFYVLSGQSWVLLMLAFITLIPFMINAIGGAITRIFDMLVLFIISPLVISTNSLYPEGKNKTYKKWKKGVQTNAYSMFGYIIGFSAFSILIPMIYNVNSFVSVSTYNRIVSIGGLGGFFTYPTINSLVKCLWVITTVSVLERVPALLLPIVTAGRGDIKSPHPGVMQEGQSFIDKTKGLTNEVKSISNKIQSVVSGKALMGAVANAKEEMLGMIPGSEFAKMAKEGIFDPMMKENRAKKTEQEQKEIEKLLKDYGIDDKTAKAAGAAFKKAQEQKEKRKTDNKKKWDNYKKAFRELL